MIEKKCVEDANKTNKTTITFYTVEIESAIFNLLKEK